MFYWNNGSYALSDKQQAAMIMMDLRRCCSARDQPLEESNRVVWSEGSALCLSSDRRPDELTDCVIM